MNIKITGISGYLGKVISKKLIENKHEVSGIKRDLLYGPREKLMNEIKNADVIINLAGAPILQRWTNKNKTIIIDSRVKTTQNLIAAINKLPSPEQPKKFISASAVGIYKPGFKHNESSANFDDGFVGKVVKDWEAASEQLPQSIQKIIFRVGIVLGNNAKTISNLMLPFRLGFGATIGNGNQPFPFIHEKDAVSAFVWAIEKGLDTGIYNLVAPENSTNKDFTKAFAKILYRPAFLFIPSFILKLILGEASELLLKGTEVEPKKLLEQGFEFKYPDIHAALSEIII